LSKTTTALLIKFLLTLVSAYIAFSIIDNNGFGWILGLSIAVTALNYLLGDLAILPKYGNFSASVADGGLAALTAYLAGIMFRGNDVGIGSLITFFLLITVAEYFFHNYLLESKKVEPNT